MPGQLRELPTSVKKLRREIFKEVANQCARILNIPPDKNVVE